MLLSKLKMVAFLFIVLAISSCGREELIIERYENGNPKKTRIIDRLFSYEKNYDLSGKLSSEGYIYENEKKDEWTYYHENGKVAKSVNYREGKLFQGMQEFYESGKLKIKGEYDEDGYRTGSWIYYSEEEQVKEKGKYYKGQKIGNWKYFAGNRCVKLEEFYNEYGDLELQLLNDEKGRLKKRTEFYKRNEVKSEYERIDQDSDEIHVILFYENGQKKEEGNKNGLYEVGKWKFWDKSGNKIAEGDFEKEIKELMPGMINENIKISKRDARKLEKLCKMRKTEGVKVGTWKYLDKKKRNYKEVSYSIKDDSTLFVKVN